MTDKPLIKLRQLPRTRRQTISIVIALMSVSVAGVLLYAVTHLKPKPVSTVLFDPAQCVRVSDVTKVYKIKAEIGRPHILWFATQEGLRRFDTQTFTWTRFGLDHGLPSEHVVDLAFGAQRIWVATDNGAAWMDLRAGQAFTVVPESDKQLVLGLEYVPGQGVCMFAGDRGLLYIPDRQTGVVSVPLPEAGEKVTCLKQIDSVLYVGIKGQGLYRYGPATGSWQRFVLQGAFSPETEVYDVVRHGDALWIASSAEGLWRAPAGNDTFAVVPEFPAKGAYALAEEPDGLWCGTPWGLWRYYDRSGTWMQFVHPREKNPADFQVFALWNTREMLWYGSRDLGAGCFDKTTAQWQQLRAGLSRQNVAALTATDSTLWTAYGYQGGWVDRWDLPPLQFDRNYGEADGLTDGHIQALAVAAPYLYCGGFSGFGVLNTRTGQLVFHTVGDGLPASDIAAIDATRPDTVLLASTRGVIAYIPEQGTFTTLPGTQRFRVTCLRQEGTDLYFGTLTHGAWRYDRAADSLAGMVADVPRVVGIVPCTTDSLSFLCVATRQNGCFFYNALTHQLSPLTIPEKLREGTVDETANHILAARGIDNRIWLGTREKGCLVYDPEKGWGTFDYFDGLINDQVRSFADTRDYVLIGSYGGVTRLPKAAVAGLLHLPE